VESLRAICFTHAVLNRPIMVYPHQIFSVFQSAAIPGLRDPRQMATYIMAVGGGVVPVSESPEEVRTKLETIEEKKSE
jgi:hypothetical protein